MGACKVLVCLLFLECFLSWDYLDEVGIAVFRLMVHKNSGSPGSCMGNLSSYFSDKTWLDRDHMVNQVHITRPGFQGITYWSPRVFSLGPPCPIMGLQNMQVVQGGSFLTLRRFLGFINLLYNLRRDLKVQWFILWWQTSISLLSCIKRFLVDHSFATSSPMILAPTTYF